MNRSIINALAICLLLTMAGGCVSTQFESPSGFKVDRKAFLYPFKTGGFEFDPQTGLITMLDYNTDGGGDNLKAAFEAVYSAGEKAGKAKAGL